MDRSAASMAVVWLPMLVLFAGLGPTVPLEAVARLVHTPAEGSRTRTLTLTKLVTGAVKGSAAGQLQTTAPEAPAAGTVGQLPPALGVASTNCEPGGVVSFSVTPTAGL